MRLQARRAGATRRPCEPHRFTRRSVSEGGRRGELGVREKIGSNFFINHCKLFCGLRRTKKEVGKFKHVKHFIIGQTGYSSRFFIV